MPLVTHRRKADGERRTRAVNFRLTEQEYANLASIAGDLSVSEYVRTAILAGAPESLHSKVDKVLSRLEGMTVAARFN